MFAVGVFPTAGGSESVALIHKSWVVGNKCFYPPDDYDYNSLMKAVRDGEKPDTATWPLWEMRISRNKYYQTFKDARANLPGAEVPTDDQGTGVLGKRKSKQKKPYVGSVSGSSNAGHIVAQRSKSTKSNPKRAKTSQGKVQPLPSPPKLPIVSPKPTVAPRLIAVGTLESSVATPGPSTATSPPELPSASVFSRALEDFSNHSDSSSVASGEASEVEMAHSPKSVGNRVAQNLCEITPEMMKSVLTNQELMMMKIDMVLDINRTLLQGKKVETEIAATGSFELPITSYDDFCNLHEKIKADKKLKSDLFFRQKVETNTPNERVHLIVGALMTNELMQQFTMDGQTGKHRFRNFVYYMSCIYEATKAKEIGKLLEDKQIAKAANYWLTKATWRINRAAEKAAKAAARAAGSSAEANAN